jgi:saccharopine dehydrogenase-like NADP-dependent oxidoreductase
MRVLVLGGYGAVGRHLVSMLRHDGHTAVAAGRDTGRADAVMDLDDPELDAYRATLPRVDVVVNASGAENPRLAALAGASDCAFIDISATAGYLDQLRQLPSRGPIIVDVGLAPGLTNLLAIAVHSQARTPGPIDLAVLLGAGERHGAAATDWSYRLLGAHFHDDDRRIRNYTRPEAFTLPGHRGPRRLVRLDFSDQHTLRRELNVPVRTFFGLDSRLATAALAALTWLPGASKAPRGLHLPGTDRWIVLARGHDGTARWAQGRSQSRATAAVAAEATARALSAPHGVHPVHHILTLDDLPAEEIKLDQR